MDILGRFPILIIDGTLNSDTGKGRAVNAIVEKLKKKNFSVITATTVDDGISIIQARKEIGGILIDWEIAENNMDTIIQAIRSINDVIPIFIMTYRHKLNEIDVTTLQSISGYIWKMEDTPDFISGRVELAVKRYLTDLAPPFFKELVNYVEDYNYAWHTPGHMGGEAFMKSPAGKMFYDFFGETVFRADLSVSVTELGSLMEHTGVIGESEREAAETFGADYTYFVTNGTSTSNKIVLCSTVTPGDIVLIDRNCHKSLHHALTITGAIPVYFIPTRNAYGIIGGISYESFKKKNIQAAIDACPLVKDKKVKPKLAVITNSTYDGLLYDVVKIKDILAESVDQILFDEAWYAYAKFHELYDNRFGMCTNHSEKHPAIFATQSTHKLLAAFSQASMIHIRNGKKTIDPDLFNEAFMMHTSTSPQYIIIASLDVASKMMEGSNGHALVQDAIDEAVLFRKKMIQISEDIKSSSIPENQKWFFGIWQPEKVKKGRTKKKVLENVSTDYLEKDPTYWYLNKKDQWHGYQDPTDEFMMLDPIKVNITTPGVNPDGTLAEQGIPALILAKYLAGQGIVDEKTGFYTFLLLFSIGVTKAKSGTLLASLFKFKELYDQDASLIRFFPELVSKHPQKYEMMTIQVFAQEMHQYLKNNNITQIDMTLSSKLPDPIMTPSEAYYELVRGNIEDVELDQLKDRITSVMIVPYPPGIPIIMPGEKFGDNVSNIIDYLKILEEFDNRFPGFETETHGVEVKEINGRKKYFVSCIKDK